MKEVAEGKKDCERKEGRMRDGERRRRKEEGKEKKGRKDRSSGGEEMNKLR
jgi:hypothetical protein